MKPRIGQTVYHRASNKRGICTGIIQRINGAMYLVVWDEHDEQCHYDFELTDEKEFNE